MGIAGLLRGRLVALAAQRELRRWQCSGRVQAPTVQAPTVIKFSIHVLSPLVSGCSST